VQLACSGKSLYDKAAPNCRRLCCGAFGRCTDECEGGGRHDGCAVRVLIVATLDDIRAGLLRISLRGKHVPEWMQLRPPPLNGLKPMPAALRQLRAECAKGAVSDGCASTRNIGPRRRAPRPIPTHPHNPQNSVRT
jgi:hypothetical protein